MTEQQASARAAGVSPGPEHGELGTKQGEGAQPLQSNSPLTLEGRAQGEGEPGIGAIRESPNSADGEKAQSPPEDKRDAEISRLTQDVEALKAQLAAAQKETAAEKFARQEDVEAVRKQLTDQLANAAARYKTAVLEQLPEVPRDLVDGDTIEQVETSIARARGIVQQVKEQLAGQAAQAVTAGAPVRNGADVDSLSALDKIKYSLSHRKR